MPAKKKPATFARKPGDPGYVGRGHPPTEHQFKKGQSGNPKGRPTGRHRHDTLLEKYLREPVTLKDGRTMRPEKLIVSILNAKIATGDVKAIEVREALYDRVCPRRQENDTGVLEPVQKQRLLDAARRLALSEDPLAAAGDDTRDEEGGDR